MKCICFEGKAKKLFCKKYKMELNHIPRYIMTKIHPQPPVNWNFKL